MNRKQMRKQMKRRAKGRGRKNPAYDYFNKPFIAPEGVTSTATIPPASIEAFGKGIGTALVDMMLGVMFVQALKKTGTREAVLKLLFEPKETSDPETPESPMEPETGDRPN